MIEKVKTHEFKVKLIEEDKSSNFEEKLAEALNEGWDIKGYTTPERSMERYSALLVKVKTEDVLEK